MGLELKNVSKTYGDKKVVDNISIKLDKPSVFGLLGTNGAGKTTTIRMLLGILRKDVGTITWNDKNVERKSVNFGYLPEERGLYQKTIVKKQLRYFAELKGMNKEEIEKAIDYWAKTLKVEEYLPKKAEELSKGNQQKIQFMASLLHDPDLIVLDEPFSGLDPINSELLKTVLRELVAKGKYIIMSSHQMQSIEEFCLEILILNKGKTVIQGNLREIKDSYEANRLVINTETDIKEYIRKHSLEIENINENTYTLKIKGVAEAQGLLKNITENNIDVYNFEIKKPTLHDIFIEKVGG